MLLDCLVFDNQSILCQQIASAPYFYDLFDNSDKYGAGNSLERVVCHGPF
jgi:hypothetical protein